MVSGRGLELLSVTVDADSNRFGQRIADAVTRPALIQSFIALDRPGETEGSIRQNADLAARMNWNTIFT